MLKQLKKAQDAEHDQRDSARQDKAFIEADHGQWEDKQYEQNKDNPRYQFDQSDPLIDQISGDMEKRDFNIKVNPSGGESSKDTAQTYDGLLRNIENISSATNIFNRAGREMTTCGLDGWRVVQKYVDDNSFDQDLLIEKIANYLDRVWLGPHEEPDGSDAKMGWILTAMDTEEYKTAYPDRPEASVQDDRSTNVFFYRPEKAMVGEFLYIKDTEREIVLMSSGNIYEVDSDEYKKVADDLQRLGITEVARRKRQHRVVYSRLFDNAGWIKGAKKTVFENWLPIIPLYGNFRIIEDKVIYRGAIRKIRDPQMVLNYSLSREIGEGALSPRGKYWATPAQVKGHTDTLATLNTNSDPIQVYNNDPEVPGPPIKQEGGTINPGLSVISGKMQAIIGQTVGMFASNMGDNPFEQSGVAIDKLIGQGDKGNNKYVISREVAQHHTGRILVNAIPRVYTAGRQVRLLKDDGSFDMQVLGEQVTDQDTGQMVTLNNLAEGTYDVICTSGPSFQNKQSETVDSIIAIGAADPSIIELGSDVLLSNITSPGMDQIAARKRLQLLNAGVIPPEQMTDEEKAKTDQAKNEPQQPDAMTIAAMAEDKKAEADMTEAKTKQMEVQADIIYKTKEIEIKTYDAQTKRIEAENDKTRLMLEAKAKGAKAAKDLAEAEAQDIENRMVESGLGEILKDATSA